MNRPAGGSLTPAHPTGRALDLGVTMTYQVSSTVVCPTKQKEKKERKKNRTPNVNNCLRLIILGFI
jgi:hypothetical protein